MIVLAKLKPSTVTSENILDTLQLTLLNRNPVDSLYKDIHAVYAPLLLKYIYIYLALQYIKLNIKDK